MKIKRYYFASGTDLTQDIISAGPFFTEEEAVDASRKAFEEYVLDRLGKDHVIHYDDQEKLEATFEGAENYSFCRGWWSFYDMTSYDSYYGQIIAVDIELSLEELYKAHEEQEKIFLEQDAQTHLFDWVRGNYRKALYLTDEQISEDREINDWLKENYEITSADFACESPKKICKHLAEHFQRRYTCDESEYDQWENCVEEFMDFLGSNDPIADPQWQSWKNALKEAST